MERVGNSPPLKKIINQARANVVTPAHRKLVEAALEIQANPNEADEAFMARHLVQCTLPHTNPGKVEAWERRNGNLTLVIRPGWDSEKRSSIGYPYGVIPRLLLFWMTTEAARVKNRADLTLDEKRTITLGHNLSAFMRQLGLIPSSAGAGKRSDARRLQNQMERLFRSIISFEIHTTEPHRHGKSWLDMQAASRGQLWWSPKDPDQGALWGSWITLGEDFYKAITSSMVPCDMQALRALKRSPLALDLYALAIHKAFMANKRNAKEFIPWNGLSMQLGADYDPGQPHEIF
jgi:Plasmid encoded RepA protein